MSIFMYNPAPRSNLKGRHGDDSAEGVQPVKKMEFRVCRRGRRARWVVTVGDSIYGAYLDK